MDVTEIQTELITKIYKQYSSDLKLYFMKYTHDMMSAEDFVQDLFVKLLSYDGIILESSSRGFVFTMAKRMVMDYERHKKIVRGYLSDFNYYESLGTAVQLPSIECKQIEEAESAVVRRLPKQMARVYSVSRFEYLDISEIAQKMNLSKRTVEYHLYMARKRVRESVRIAIGM